MERLGLSLGVGFAVAPLAGVVVNAVGTVSLAAVMAATIGVTVVSVAVAAHRRLRLPPEERFAVPVGAWAETVVAPGSRAEAAMSLVLVVALVSAGVTVAGSPSAGDEAAFTEFYLLTETERGELVAGNYPESLVAGDSYPLYAGITSHEDDPTDYTVVAELHRVESGPDGPRIVERDPLYRATPGINPGTSWEGGHRITPSIAGDRLRLTYMLYVGDPPPEPTPENAYRELHLWVEVSTGESGT